MADLPNHPRFFDDDSEYLDLGSGELAAKRYLRLICSADYRSNPLNCVRGDRRTSEDLSLPPNLLTEGRRLTPALKLKIRGALAVCPLHSTFRIRVYQLFRLVQFFGWRYNYKSNCWEAQEL
ncbi:MAG: hypothetical protein EAZ33_12235 [Oscillatoriales cyanobacterium]|nr:MAG: hypothetical protein EAZ33_12235 [Oscillatoriales cyanobacterium]TAG58471.1 MAG: hypothetical protein EAZ28_14605 [Oscillatoriales cyanobacterium]